MTMHTGDFIYNFKPNLLYEGGIRGGTHEERRTELWEPI
jgi:hypothetical protein